MKTLLNKLDRIAKAIAKDLGTLSFFALVHRADAVDSWDLVVSSSALPSEKMAALGYVARYVQKALTKKEIVRLSRIVTLPPDNPIVREFIEDDSLPRGRVFIPTNPRFDRAYIIVPRARAPRAAAV